MRTRSGDATAWDGPFWLTLSVAERGRVPLQPEAHEFRRHPDAAPKLQRTEGTSKSEFLRLPIAVPVART